VKHYAVEVTGTTAAAILAHARYIADDRQEPQGAEAWLASAWDAVESLETMPKRCPVAAGFDGVPYEVRSVLAGSVSLLFTVSDERDTVWVIAVRGQGQLPRLDQLPPTLDALVDEDDRRDP